MRMTELCRERKRNRRKPPCRPRTPESCSLRTTLKNRQGSLRGAHGPATGIAHGRERVAVQWGGPVEAQGFEMIRRRVALMAREAVLRIDGVPLFHAGVAMCLRKDGCGSNGNAACVAFDQRLLLD